MPNLTRAFAFLLDLARRYPLAALGALLLALLWVTIHARPRLTSKYESEFPEAWRERWNRYRRDHPAKRCNACLLWNLLEGIPVVGRAFHWIHAARIQLHHWAYPSVPGTEKDRHLSWLCTDRWPDHHGDADDWRRFAESLPLIGRWAWAPIKVAFFTTAFVCQLGCVLLVLGGLTLGIGMAIVGPAEVGHFVQNLAEHVTVH